MDPLTWSAAGMIEASLELWFKDENGVWQKVADQVSTNGQYSFSLPFRPGQTHYEYEVRLASYIVSDQELLPQSVNGGGVVLGSGNGTRQPLPTPPPPRLGNASLGISQVPGHSVGGTTRNLVTATTPSGATTSLVTTGPSGSTTSTISVPASGAGFPSNVRDTLNLDAALRTAQATEKIADEQNPTAVLDLANSAEQIAADATTAHTSAREAFYDSVSGLQSTLANFRSSLTFPSLASSGGGGYSITMGQAVFVLESPPFILTLFRLLLSILALYAGYRLAMSAFQ